ncbi:MAG TPA: hypothetical protein ENH96_01325 [Chlamydiae bacterium]|nr:hypothetical protein [Candidatus Anoxychlamydiales bacterium]HEU64015.1 hypothetical protein [Chlamydiota bacterium]
MISEKLLNKIFAYFILLLVILSALMFFIFAREEKLENASYIKRDEKKEVSLDVVSKALFLEPFKFDISINSIKDEIEVQIVEKRPDSKVKQEKFEIKFKKSSKILKVIEDEKFFVAVDKNGNFEFSDVKTPLVIFLKAIDKKNVKVVMETDLEDFMKDTQSKTIFFVLSPTDFVYTKDIDTRDDLKLLASSKWFSKDELQKFYKTKNGIEPKERLEIDGKIVHLNSDDVLIFKDGIWQKPISLGNTQSYTIAKIKSIDSKILEIEAWDENSNKYIFALPSQVKQGFSIRPDQFVTAIRKRTITHFSCQIEKQRVILKEKDILIKKDGRWRLLKKDIDFDEIKNEELFYFDKIENKNNKNFFVGYLFNPMRTNYQKIETPILSSVSQRINKKRVIR